jgi:hypothetical protein
VSKGAGRSKFFGRKRPQPIVAEASAEERSFDPKKSRDDCWRFLELIQDEKSRININSRKT